MSDTDIRVGKSIDDAIKFAFKNIGSIIKVGWLPIALTLGIIAAFMWTFWQPLILASIEFFNALALAPTPEEIEVISEGLALAIEQTGLGTLLLGYIVILTVSLAGFAIPMTAYCRMMILGEHYRGPFFLRLGRREIDVALTYLAITMVIFVAMILIALVGGVLFALAAGALGDAAAVAVGLFTIFYMIAVLVSMFWLFGRLGFALPMAALEGGIPIGRAWALSKSVGGTMGWIVVLGYLLLMVFSMIAAMVMGLIVGIVSAVLESLGSQMVPVFTGAVWAIGYIGLYCFSTAFFMAMFAGPYKRLTEERV